MLKSQVRNTNIEVLRFVLMCFIFFWHIIVHGYGFAEIGNDGFDYTASMWVTIPLCVLFVPATYCFVFISGFYGLHFSLRKLLQLVLWCISASVLSTLFCHLLWSDTISLHRLVCSLLPITTKSYWFITEYVLLFIISPFLNFGCERLTKRELRAVLALLFIYDAIKLVLLKANVGSDIVGFMFIYILGRYIHQHGVNFAKMGGGKNTIFIFYIVCFVSLTFLLFGGWWLADVSHIHKTQKLVFSLLGYINPFIIGMAVTIFLLVHRMQPTYNSTLNKIVSPNLFIYLFTALCAFGSHINPFLAEMFSRNCLLAVIISFAIILGCLIIGKMIEYVVSHFVDYIFRCVNKRL